MAMMVRQFLAVAAVSLATIACGGPAAPATAPAQGAEPHAPELNDANHRAAAAQLLERIHIDQLIETMIDSSAEAATKTVPNGQAGIDLMREIMREALNPKELMDEFVTIYMRHFTQRELESLNAFYSTELGQKLIAKMPELTREGAELGARRMQERLPELMAKYQDRILQLQNDAPPSR